MGQTTDTITGRRQSWDGVAVHDLAPHNGGDYESGRYWRVTSSWRDSQTGEFRIYCHEPLGTIRPQGEPVYKYDGTTWDMPAYAMTVVPWGFITFAGILLVVMNVFIVHVSYSSGGSDDDALGGMMIASFAWALTVPRWLYAHWQVKIEPVRGTAILAAVVAYSMARDQERKRESVEWNASANARSPFNGTPYSPYTTPAFTNNPYTPKPPAAPQWQPMILDQYGRPVQR